MSSDLQNWLIIKGDPDRGFEIRELSMQSILTPIGLKTREDDIHKLDV